MEIILMSTGKVVDPYKHFPEDPNSKANSLCDCIYIERTSARESNTRRRYKRRKMWKKFESKDNLLSEVWYSKPTHPEYAPEVGPANRAPGDWGLRGFLQAPGLLQRPWTDPVCLSWRDVKTVRGRRGWQRLSGSDEGTHLLETEYVLKKLGENWTAGDVEY